MELMTKFGYTYFIYPYVIRNEEYYSYMKKLLKDKKCRLRVFEEEKDMHLYQYFLPAIRDYMFWTFGLDKRALKDFEKLDIKLKADVLSEHECNIFGYNLSKDIQGKIGEKGGIFFDINEIKLICFKTGICFLVLKTTLIENNGFGDILNFNYKFREINSTTYNMKDYENIKLQSDIFKDVKEISDLIKEITGKDIESKKINLDKEKMNVYTYCCLDQNSWNQEVMKEAIDNMFEKYRMVLPANKQILDTSKKDMQLYENSNIRYGFSPTSTALMTSDVSTENYTTVAQKYESEYLYTYIFELYKKILMKKINIEINEKTTFKDLKNNFINFSKKLLVQEVTNDEFGKRLIDKWRENFSLDDSFVKLKSKYDILYKKYDVEKLKTKTDRLTLVITILIAVVIVDIILRLLG